MPSIFALFDVNGLKHNQGEVFHVSSFQVSCTSTSCLPQSHCLLFLCLHWNHLACPSVNFCPKNSWQLQDRFILYYVYVLTKMGQNLKPSMILLMITSCLSINGISQNGDIKTNSVCYINSLFMTYALKLCYGGHCVVKLR